MKTVINKTALATLCAARHELTQAISMLLRQYAHLDDFIKQYKNAKEQTMNVENKNKWIVDIAPEDIAGAKTLSEVFDKTQAVMDRLFREASVKCKRCVTCKHLNIVACQNQVLHDLMTLGRSYNRTFEIICKANQPCFMDSETECSAYSENQKATALYGNPFLKCKCGSTDTYTTAECYKGVAK